MEIIVHGDYKMYKDYMPLPIYFICDLLYTHKYQNLSVLDLLLLVI